MKVKCRDWSFDLDAGIAVRVDGARFVFVRDPCHSLDWTALPVGATAPLEPAAHRELLMMWGAMRGAHCPENALGRPLVDLFLRYGFAILDLERSALAADLKGEPGVLALIRHVEQPGTVGPQECVLVAVEDSSDVLASACALQLVNLPVERRLTYRVLLRLEPDAVLRDAIFNHLRATADSFQNAIRPLPATMTESHP